MSALDAATSTLLWSKARKAHDEDGLYPIVKDTLEGYPSSNQFYPLLWNYERYCDNKSNQKGSNPESNSELLEKLLDFEYYSPYKENIDSFENIDGDCSYTLEDVYDADEILLASKDYSLTLDCAKYCVANSIFGEDFARERVLLAINMMNEADYSFNDAIDVADGLGPVLDCGVNGNWRSLIELTSSMDYSWFIDFMRSALGEVTYIPFSDGMMRAIKSASSSAKVDEQDWVRGVEEIIGLSTDEDAVIYRPRVANRCVLINLVTNDRTSTNALMVKRIGEFNTLLSRFSGARDIRCDASVIRDSLMALMPSDRSMPIRILVESFIADTNCMESDYIE